MGVCVWGKCLLTTNNAIIRHRKWFFFFFVLLSYCLLFDGVDDRTYYDRHVPLGKEHLTLPVVTMYILAVSIHLLD